MPSWWSGCWPPTALQIAADGPAMQYVGAAASYRIRLRNPGNAPARNVRVSAADPAGAEYRQQRRGPSDGRRPPGAMAVADAGGRAEQGFVVKCNLAVPGRVPDGSQRLADDELAAATAAVTRVEAMAELRLDVKEPDGPVPVGEEAAYESTSATAVRRTPREWRFWAYFSPGIEPVAADGALHRLGPGRLLSEPSLAGGRRGDQAHRPARGGYRRKPRLPGRSPLQAAGSTPGKRTDHALLSG